MGPRIRLSHASLHAQMLSHPKGDLKSWQRCVCFKKEKPAPIQTYLLIQFPHKLSECPNYSERNKRTMNVT